MRNVFEVPRPPWGPRYGPYMAFRRHPTLDHVNFTYVAPDPPLEPSEFDRLLQESGRLLLQEDGGLILLQGPSGPFTVSFAGLADGSVPYTGTGLRDAFLDIPRSQDEMGIRDGKLAVVNFRGPDQEFYPADAGGGRRGLLWRDTGSLTDNVSGRYDDALYTGVDPPLPAFTPTLHISLDEDDHWLGIASWFVPPPFSWGELGVIGWKQEEFSYLDMHLGLDFPEPGDDIRLRSVGGMVAVEINGETVLGPCEIPAELLGSPIHGIQMDVQLDTDEELGVAEAVIIEEDSTPLGTRSAPLTPDVGVPAEANSTTINVPYPAGIVAGNSLYCIVATKNAGTISASGWSAVTGNFGVALGLSIRVMRKTATGSESGSLTVTKSSSGIMAAVMVRVTGDTDQSATSGQNNTSASTALTAPAIQLFGPRRTAIWIAGTSVDTDIASFPSGFFPLSGGVAGGEAIRLLVGVAILDTIPDFPDPPIFAAYGGTFIPAQVGTAVSPTASAVGMLILHPATGT